MANSQFRYPDNAPGPFFVDSECIACDTCAGISPNHFKLVQDNDHAVVYCQPKTESDISLCLDAMKACPVDAIGQTK